MTQTGRAHISLLGTTLIFGLHYAVAKSLMPHFLTPMQLIFVRLLGGLVLFWAFQRLFVHEKVDRKDFFKLALLGALGFALNQSLFYEGLNITTPFDASVIHVLNPILVMVFAFLIISEKITPNKMAGIGLGAAGALLLILFGRKAGSGEHSALGNFLVFLNMVFYALYLVLLKPLTAKYHTSTILKWVSLFGFLFILPFSIKPALSIDFGTFTPYAWIALAFIIIFCTFLAYILINFALKRVSPSVVSYYNYLQPVIAAVSSVSIGEERITWIKVVAAVLIFSGVYVVTREKKQPELSEQVSERQ
jgi:drug/metabolite transporter (DMT)-like permease